MFDREEPVPGKRYRITIEDCCIWAELYGTFLHVHDLGYDCEYHFDIGIISPAWGAWKVEEEETK